VVQKVAPQAVRKLLEDAAKNGVAIMAFLGNGALTQIYSGKVNKVMAAEGWFNVLDPDFNLHLQTRACKARAPFPLSPSVLTPPASQFVKFQEVRLQEMSEDVPMGHIPRSLTAMVKGELVRLVSPGDIIEMTGIFLPKPATNGFRVRAHGPAR
jgi:DNA replicative helicase MCM subunit Mcm2 (Cdc46/Mcm family)